MSHLPKDGNDENDNADDDNECFGKKLSLVERRRLIAFYNFLWIVKSTIMQ